MSRNSLTPAIIHEQFNYFCYLREMGLRGIMIYTNKVVGKWRDNDIVMTEFYCVGTGNYLNCPEHDNDVEFVIRGEPV